MQLHANSKLACIMPRGVVPTACLLSICQYAFRQQDACLRAIYTTGADRSVTQAKSHLGLVGSLSRGSLPPSSKCSGRLALALLGNNVSREAAQLGLTGSMCFPGTNDCTHQVILVVLLRFLHRRKQAC